MTAFNASDTIERALASALAQNWAATQIIVVDDASTDDTAAIVERHAAETGRITLIRNAANLGVAGSRNRLLQEADGEFVAFFDDDDESHPDRVVRQFQRIVEYERDFAQSAPVICHTARTVVYPDGRSIVQPAMGEVEGIAPNGISVAQWVLTGRSLGRASGACPTCSQMARLSTYRLVAGFDESMRRGEDTDLSIRLAVAGAHFVGVEAPLVVQHMTPTSEKSMEEELGHTLRLYAKHRQVMDDLGEYEFCREWLELKYSFLARSWSQFAIRGLKLAARHPFRVLGRAVLAMPNLSINLAFSRFHLGGS